MDMNSEQELAEHVTVDKNDEETSLCEMEESLELTGTCSTGNVTVAATAYYERDVDIEELLCDTPEPETTEITTDRSHIMELMNVMLIEENKRLALMEKMKMEKEMESKLTENIRTGLKLILECLRNTKSYFDIIETMPMYKKWEEDNTLTWEKFKDPVLVRKWRRKYLDEEYEIWIEICQTLESRRKWTDYRIMIDNFWEDFDVEDVEIIKECGRLGIHMETQREKIIKTGEEYFRNAGLNI